MMSDTRLTILDGGSPKHGASAEPGTDRAALAAALGAGGLGLQFPPALERFFELETGGARAVHMIRSGILAMLLPNVFLVSDRLLIPDVFAYALLLHVACTVTYSAVLFYTARRPRADLREAAHGLSLSVGLLGTIALVCASGAPNRAYVTSSYILFIVYVNVVMRLRFGWCVAFNAVGLLAALLSATVARGLPPGVQVLMPLSVLTAVAFTLYANYTLEAGERRAFLLALDQRLSADELAGFNARLSALSTTDWLTGIANRRGLEMSLEQAWAEAAAAHQPLALLMIDVDHFKLFNDRHGHPAGDACLRQLARLITQLLSEATDRLGRYGGEEFAVLLANTTQAEAIIAGDRIRRHVEGLALLHGAPGAGAHVTVSIGACAIYPGPGNNPDQLTAAADAALYESKQRGRNRVHPALPAFSPERERPVLS